MPRSHQLAQLRIPVHLGTQTDAIWSGKRTQRVSVRISWGRQAAKKALGDRPRRLQPNRLGMRYLIEGWSRTTERRLRW